MVFSSRLIHLRPDDRAYLGCSMKKKKEKLLFSSFERMIGATSFGRKFLRMPKRRITRFSELKSQKIRANRAHVNISICLTYRVASNESFDISTSRKLKKRNILRCDQSRSSFLCEFERSIITFNAKRVSILIYHIIL